MDTLWGIVRFIGILLAVCVGVIFVSWFMRGCQDGRMKDINKPN